MPYGDGEGDPIEASMSRGNGLHFQSWIKLHYTVQPNHNLRH